MQNMSIAFAHRYTVSAPAVEHGIKPCQLFYGSARLQDRWLRKIHVVIHDANGKIMVDSHIDDFCICGTNRACLDEFRFALLDPAKGGFEGIYEGPLHHYSGCAITRDLDAGTTSLSQDHYIQCVCQKYGQRNVTLSKTPTMSDTRHTVDDYPDSYVDPHFHAQYRGIVGSLRWIVGMTRPDCSFAHVSLSRVVQYPGPVHMQAALRVLAYLRGTIDQCLVFTRSDIASLNHNCVWGWVDADYAGCQDTRRSHTGYVLMLNGAVISWRSKQQTTVFLSSAESEFIAASQCGQEVVYLCEILKGFAAEQDCCTRIFEDNQACIAMSENTVHRERSRHIDVRKYYVRELVEDKLIKLIPCGTKEMKADALTKSLMYPAFRTHRMTMLNVTSQQETLESTSLRASACWTWA